MKLKRGFNIHRLLEPGEVAALAVYRCSDAASGITGSAQFIDCGWTAHEGRSG
jgi:3-hydroxybutyrate dehydrogenase